MLSWPKTETNTFTKELLRDQLVIEIGHDLEIFVRKKLA